MKKLLLLSFFISVTQTLLAQNDKLSYAEKAAEIQKEIWGTNVPEFKATQLPDGLKNESAVILARSYSMQKTAKNKLRYFIITAAASTQIAKVITYHERVKINDKAALEEYSELKYQKTLDNSVSFLTAKFKDIRNTYIGAKVIKPNGTENIVNTGEEVLTKNESKDKEGKLAISGLQVGDILDYYISTIEVSEDARKDTYSENHKVIVLANEYPILYYNIELKAGKKTNIRYINANGAPKFQITEEDKGDKTYSMTMRNLPKYKNEIWTSAYRQLPYVEFSNTENVNWARAFSKSFAEDSEKLNDYTDRYREYFNEKEMPSFEILGKKLKKYFGNKKALMAASLDSSMNVLYNIWKFECFGNYVSLDEDYDIKKVNYRTASSRYNAAKMSMALTDMEIDHDVLIVCARNSSSLENIFSTTDMDACIRINNGNKPLYMFFNDVFTHFNEIPARYQGEKALALKPKRKSKTNYVFTRTDAVIPAETASKNTMIVNVDANTIIDNNQKLKIKRTVYQTGTMRHDDQKALIPIGSVDDDMMKTVKGDNLAKRLSYDKIIKKFYNITKSAFEADELALKTKFTEEIKTTYEQEPQQIADCKILTMALDRSNPVYGYSESFVLDNLVKKAGNNYIIDAGKLAGTFLKLEEKDKNRTLDVYQPSSRSLKYNINIAIPKGYSAKGMEAFTKSITNNTGSLTCQATANTDNVTITLTRVFNKHFENAADWPKLVELIDGGTNFNTQKILLEKM